LGWANGPAEAVPFYKAFALRLADVLLAECWG
jgi:hypothetical protein